MVEVLEKIKYPLVAVSWYDHMTNDEWCKEDTVHKAPPIMCTVGWLVYEDDIMLNLVQCVEHGGPDIASQFVIVKSCIVQRREL